MAYKRKRSYSKKRFIKRKRTYKRKYKSKRNAPMAATYIRGRDWISNMLYNRMEYMEQIFFSSVSSPATYIFRGNSIYDPNQTGTGGQPFGFAELAAIYSAYECPSSFIRAEFINNTAVPMFISVVPVLATTDVITYNSTAARPGGKSKYCTSNNDKQHTILTNSNSTWKMLGRPQADGDVRAQITANPSAQWYWNITITSADFASAISGVLNIKLIYRTRWTNRKVI